MLQHPLILLAFMVAGYMSRYIPFIHKDAFRSINKWIIWIPLPAIMLEKISSIQFHPTFIAPVVSAWAIFLMGMVFFGLLSRIFNWDKKTWAALSLVCGLGNTSFVGYPVIRMIFGEEGIRYAILVDQPGTFLMLATLGVALAAYAGSGKFSFRQTSKKLISFPPFIGFVVAIILPAHWLDVHPANLDYSYENILHFIGLWLNPLAFLSLGMQFSFSFKEIPLTPFLTGLAFKLILAPLVLAIALHYSGISGQLFQVTVLELAMPPMLTASIIAVEYRLRPQLSVALINFGIPISALTLSLWAYFLT